MENNGAQFSEDGKYRFSLWRIWDDTKPLVMFIGLNPSTANQTEDDPTIRRVKRFAKDWGYGGVFMMNCFAFVSTDPKLLEHGLYDQRNNSYLEATAFKCKEVIFAWGNFDIVRTSGRFKELVQMFPDAKVLQKNKNGSPKHPLYIKADTIPVYYQMKT